MSKFAHVAALSPDNRVAWYDLPEVVAPDGSTARLCLRYCGGTSNRPYTNAVMKAALGRSSKNLIESVEQERADDRTLFPQHVVAGWENVFESDGTASKFSSENVADLLAALPDFLFDRVRNFAKSPSRFSKEVPNPEAFAKN